MLHILEGIDMGLLFNSAAIVSSAITSVSLYLGATEVYAFIFGAAILYIPVKMILPFGSKKPFSQTAIVASLCAIAYSSAGLTYASSFFFAIASAYLYVYWWLLIYPKIFSRKN
jgi:hypothetical protein|tara:strand:- start:3699 stop:4040 length:342 start_codon:yes stop_codon:yes gene_type:complete